MVIIERMISMLSVLCKNKINPNELTLEDFETTPELIAMYPIYYRKLLKENGIKEEDGYNLTLEDFNGVEITNENLADFQFLLYSDDHFDPNDEDDDYSDDHREYRAYMKDIIKQIVDKYEENDYSAEYLFNIWAELIDEPGGSCYDPESENYMGNPRFARKILRMIRRFEKHMKH